MKKLSVSLSICLLLVLTACDTKREFNKPKTEVRTMIIGGMPIHDHDYLTQLNVQDIRPSVQP